MGCGKNINSLGPGPIALPNAPAIAPEGCKLFFNIGCQGKAFLKKVFGVLLCFYACFYRVKLRKALANMSVVSANLAQTTASLNELLKQQNNAITSAIGNLEATSQSLKEGTKNLPNITQNLESVSRQLSEVDLKKLVSGLDATVASLQATLDKLNSPSGSMGALMNDRKLYDNLTSTTNSLNLLLQDLRLNPKRYVNVSVFGKKDKSQPLMKPMKEDSITQEQIKNQ